MGIRCPKLKRPTLALLIGVLGLMASCPAPPSSTSTALDAGTARRLNSKDWRVRYCLATERRSDSVVTRILLERLIRDSNENVASQAAVVYLSTFLRVDTEFLRDHVSLYYRLPLGISPAERPDINSAEFHRRMLRYGSQCVATHASIQVIGVIGTTEYAQLLRPLAADTNAYTAVLAAVAIGRLGNERDCVEALKSIVERTDSPPGSLFHQVESLRFLSQIDPECFERILPEFAERVRSHKRTTPAIWWHLTRLAWSRGLEVN